ncbi:phosphogluconate dehydratase [Agarivorans aestuarii]|uniref:Phosphogluconate dehydratase n=1 Tax=Agarivorans aestuarii TaxID=1563703 RepID=A0ABU7G4L4_9ALTE|nr:phosphogluconate dehydratase [Agarivorans aestuarii]MEE1674225.1 phosphogluconate dehydratase [Agarivorans aestuarii]
MNPTVKQVTQNIITRSQSLRCAYVQRMEKQAGQGNARAHLSCGNLAHAIAACGQQQKDRLLDFTKVNLAIITAYNDMLSAHQPYAKYPQFIQQKMAELGHSAQVAGGVPAMCDGVTQGQEGMDLSLYSRDLIAQSTAIGLSHQGFDACVLLGVCDKIAPGQLMGALSFGHLPTAFMPSGPMPSGISNDEKVAVRQQHAAGELDKAALQQMENKAYHAPGTCTFYGTANTNQLVFETMGLMLPGSAFVNVNTALRDKLNQHLLRHMVGITRGGSAYRPLYQVIDERAIVNGLVALLASGGSTNHTLHMIAIARCAGIIINWDDFAQLAEVVPQLSSMYPNGPADINAFEQAGGVPCFLRLLAQRDLLHMDANTLYGKLSDYLQSPLLEDGELLWHPAQASNNSEVIAADDKQFNHSGGLQVLSGNLGRAVIKTSAVKSEHQVICAPAKVFDCQHQVVEAYQQGLLNQDAVVVVRYNGPAANGMPELHKLMPILGNLQKQGFKVALLTDGRLSGASGKIPAALHLSPETAKGGLLAKLQDGDMIYLDAIKGRIELHVSEQELLQRESVADSKTKQDEGCGRELFNPFRRLVGSAESGATILFDD